MNVSATLSIFRLLRDPSLCLPHCTISTFQQLPIPISQAFTPTTTTTATTGNNHNNNNNDNYHDDNKEIDIRAIVLDKDNCFARPGENEVYQPYQVSFFLIPFPFYILFSQASFQTSFFWEVRGGAWD